jgi:nucleoside-diphosphate-sugar epimerase
VAQRVAATLRKHPTRRCIGVGRHVPLDNSVLPDHFIVANLDAPKTPVRLAGLATAVVMLAPPPAEGTLDTRSRKLAAALSKGGLPHRLIYVSTTGVYGDCSQTNHQGDLWIDETRPVNPQSERAVRRVSAEQTWRDWCRRNQVALSILRVPGIYAADRLPTDRLSAGTPALLPDQDHYSNHIHADDLAAIIIRCLTAPQARGGRAFNIVDESDMKMGDYFDLVADALGKQRVPRRSAAEVKACVSPMTWSFMRESRRIVCGAQSRLYRDLNVRLRYRTVNEFLRSNRL